MSRYMRGSTGTRRIEHDRPREVGTLTPPELFTIEDIQRAYDAGRNPVGTGEPAEDALAGESPTEADGEGDASRSGPRRTSSSSPGCPASGWSISCNWRSRLTTAGMPRGRGAQASRGQERVQPVLRGIDADAGEFSPRAGWARV